MDRDFHFGATLHAAIKAGFSNEDALVIARAAQYVDLFDGCELDDINKECALDENTTLQTVQNTPALVLRNAANWRGVDPRTAEIWTSFHFLPGNYPSPKGDSGHVVRVDVAEDSKLPSLAPLLCRPYGPMASLLATRAKEKLSASSEATRLSALIYIGMVMHVLADTFAHANFIGLPTVDFNDVSMVRDVDKNTEIKFAMFDRSAAIFGSGYGNLGHGRIGHLPDNAWLHYSYKPSWSEVVLLDRNNPLIYAEAYLYLKHTLRFITGQKDHMLSCKPSDDAHYNKGLTKWLDFFRTSGDSVEAQESAWYERNKKSVEAADFVPVFVDAVIDDEEDADFMRRFALEARAHADFICDNCPPLESVLASSRITG